MSGGVIYDETRTILRRISKVDTINFEIPSKVVEIIGGSKLNSAFSPCAANIKTVTFQEASNLTTVGKDLFSETSLQEIDMSPCTYLTRMSEGLFFKCANLISVKLPPNLEVIPIGTFSYCTHLRSIDIPDSVKKIEGYSLYYSSVFYKTYDLERVIIQNTSLLEEIGSHTFMESGFKTIYFPKKLNYIGHCPFLGSPVEKIEIDKENTVFKTDEKGFFITKGNEIVTVVPKYTGSFTVQENATFGSQCFRGTHISEFIFPFNKKYQLNYFCFGGASIKTIKLPDLIEEIPGYCFFYSSLETIVLPTSTIKIRESAFENCINLTHITLPEGLKEIHNYAFRSCYKLIRIEIPSSILIYKEGVFARCNPNIEIIFKNSSHLINSNGLIIFNNETIDFIDKDANNDIEFPASSTYIGNELFSYKRLKKLTFATPSKVTRFGYRAFYCSLIQEIVFPSSLIEIDKECFENCKLLKKVSIDGTLEFTSISNNCFNLCESLESVIFIKNTIKNISKLAFNGTKKLTSIDFTNIVSIGEEAFQFSNLRTVTLPSTVQTVANFAFSKSSIEEFISSESNIIELSIYLFSNAKSLLVVELGSKVREIGIYCFEGCSSLRNLTLSPATEVICERAFSMCTSLELITIPPNSCLRYILPFAFYGSNNFHCFDVEEGADFLFSNGCLLNSLFTRIIYYVPNNSIKTFIVPGSVELIGDYAFSYCKCLSEVIIPDGAFTRIGYSAFEGCTNLKRIIFPNSLVVIETNAFYECSGLECGSVIINENLIEQAKAAGINRNILQPHCFHKKDYVQFGRKTCKHVYRKHIKYYLLLI